MQTIIEILLAFAIIPALVIYGGKKWKFVSQLGLVFTSYLLGSLIGTFKPWIVNKEVMQMTTQATVAFAISLLLLSTHFVKWVKTAKSTVISFSIHSAICIAVPLIVAYLFKPQLGVIAGQVAGMLAGVYTGGTPNMTAIAQGLKVDPSIYMLVNAGDMVFSTIYLMLFTSNLGARIFGLVLRPYEKTKNEINFGHIEEVIFTSLPFSQKIIQILLSLLIALIITLLSVFCSKFFPGTFEETAVILFVSTFSIVLSFIPKFRNFKGTFETGEYLLLTFSFAMGSLTDFSQVFKSGNATYLAFIGIVLYSIVILHLIFCKIFKIDRDTFMVTSCAGIMSPPFIGPVVKTIGNRELFVSGITSGLIGYAIGNYWGIIVHYLVN